MTVGARLFRARIAMRVVAATIVILFGLPDLAAASHTVAIDSGPSGVTNQDSATFTFSSSDGSATFRCSLDGSRDTPCTSPQSYGPLADGPHVFEVVARDRAGTASSPATRSWTIDTVPPDTAITSGPTGTVASDSATFSFTSTESNSSFRCSLDGGGLNPCSSPHTFNALSDGSHTFAVVATDPAGNSDPSPATGNWTVAMATIQTTILSGPDRVTPSTRAEFEFSSSEAGASFLCAIDDAPMAACTSPEIYSDLRPGSHEFEVAAVGRSGNTDPTPSQWIWIVDLSTPDTFITSGPSGAVTSKNATFEFAASKPNATFRCSLDGGSFTSCSTPKLYQNLSEDTHTFEVKAKDVQGQEDQTPATRTWSVDSPGASPTYKILTYNTAALPVTPFSGNTFGELDSYERGVKIAKFVRDGRYHIVAFNEVFDESMRSALKAHLGVKYPYYITKLKSPNPGTEDSGLMVFSKFKFKPVETPDGSLCYKEDPNGKCRAAFHIFQAAFGSDFFADKGVGFSRFENPKSGRPINVFFTHMQATYDDPAASATTRELQMVEIQDFMTRWVPKSAPGDTVLMGDINIIGKSTEWEDQIHTGGFASSVTSLEDAWLHTSPEDEGFTWADINSVHPGSTNERLDYLLWRDATPARPSCFQHHTVERHFKADLEEAGITDLSDHFGSGAVIGPDAPLCSPERAKIDHDGAATFTLKHANAYQWFRYNTPGTYTFKAGSSTLGPMELQFYDVTDLSTPLEPYEGELLLENRKEEVVVAPSGPFYVRVRAADVGAKGSYSFTATRHDCTSFKEACQIDPLAPIPDEGQMVQSPGNVNPAQKTYYMLRTNTLWSQKMQDISFKTSDHGGLPLRLHVYAKNDTQNALMTTETQQSTGFAQPAQHLDSPGFSDPSLGAIPATGADYYLVLERDPASFGSYIVEWTTNLVLLDLKTFKCWTQEDNTFDDYIFWKVTIDGGEEFQVDIGDMDTEQSKIISWPVFPDNHAIPIADNVTIKVYDYDAEEPVNGEDHLGTQSFLAQEVISDTKYFQEDDADYGLFYSATGKVKD